MFDDHLPQPPSGPGAQAPVKDLFDDAPSNLPFAPSKEPSIAPTSSSASPSGSHGAPLASSSHEATPSVMGAPAMGLPTPPSLSYAEEAPKGHGLRTVLLVLLSLVVIGIAGVLAYKLVIQPKGTEPDPIVETPATEQGTVPPEATTEQPAVTAPSTPVVTEQPVAKDTDGDGLNDTEEATHGTDPKLADTDRDGLGDREEIQVYGTDPLDPDTDKDGYLDGQEVKAGFNPNGSGKLFEIPR